MKKTFEIYSLWQEHLQDFHGFSVIEIPDVFCLQVDVSSGLQTTSFFINSTQMRRLYYEISYIWNVKPTDEFNQR